MCFSPYLGIECGWAGGGGRAPQGLVHNVIVQFFTPGYSKIEVNLLF